MYKSASQNRLRGISQVSLKDLQVDGEQFLSHNDRIEAFKRALRAIDAEMVTCTNEGWRRHLAKRKRKLEHMRRGLGKRTPGNINFHAAFFQAAKEIIQPGLFEAICGAARRNALYKPLSEAQARAVEQSLENLTSKLTTIEVSDLEDAQLRVVHAEEQ